MVKSSPGVNPKPRFGPILDLTGSLIVHVAIFQLLLAHVHDTTSRLFLFLVFVL